MDNNLKSVTNEAKACPHCYVKDGILKCKKSGLRCNYLNCPYRNQDNINYGDGY